MFRLIIFITVMTSFLYSAQMPKMGFEKSFYIENTCDSFKYNKESKDFNPEYCLKKNKTIFEVDYCTIVDNGILCISSEHRANFFFKVNFIITDDLLIIKEKIIEVTKIVYEDNIH